MGCDNCKNECKAVEGVVESVLQEAPAMVPLYAVEGSGYRRERTLRGTVIVFCVALLVIALLVGAFGAFAYKLHIQSLERVEAINRYWIDFLREYDFEEYSYEYSQDGKGVNIIGDRNGVEFNEPETGDQEESDAEEGR